MKITRRQIRKLITEMMHNSVEPDVADHFRIDSKSNYGEEYEKYGRKAMIFKVSPDDAAVIQNKGGDLDIAIDDYVYEHIMKIAKQRGLGSNLNYSYFLSGRDLKAVEVLGDKL